MSISNAYQVGRERKDAASAMVDTLKIAKDLEAGGMPAGQSEAVAHAIGSLGIGPIKRDLDVLKALTGILTVLVLAVLWQLFTLRGEMADVRADVAGLRSEITAIRSDVAGLRSEVTAMRSEITAGFARLGKAP